MNNTHNDQFLTDCFVSYFIHLKENSNPLAFEKIYTSLFTALGGLDKEYSTSQFINKMKEDFILIANHLERVAHELYKEERRANGFRDKNATHIHSFNVKDVARKLNISEQAVRKAIKEGRLKAQISSKGCYSICEKDYKEFANSRKR